ncbi:MAG: hypothetical protein VX519_01775 [Myxococcota bacterium]|nr:hypothetical protein [Myxococcota bacterium]
MIRPLALVASALLLSSCAEPLTPGAMGTARYFGQLLGEPPLRLLPPRTDRSGNIYVVYGDSEWTDTSVYVGHAYGGWSGGCSAHRGDYGLHGFSGHTNTRGWYWSGDSLVEVNGTTGACREVVSSDPVTSTEIQFRAVVPFVRQTSARSTMLAMVQGITDPVPYHTVVDLDQRLYGDLRPFEPTSAKDIKVIGVGADRLKQRGYIAVQFTQSDTSVFQVLVLDHTGDELFRINLDGGDLLDEFDIQGELSVSETGLVAGLLSDGRILVFNNNEGRIFDYDTFEAAGVQAWGGTLWLTGSDAGQALVAPIEETLDIGIPQAWDSATALGQRINEGVVVLDERTDPSRQEHWQDAVSAMADQPLLTPHPLDMHTTGSTGWLIAGPYYDSVNIYTSVAFAPIGVSFP